MYELDKYRHEINGDGELVVYDVPIFAELERDGVVYDEAWLQDAVDNHQKRYKANGYMAPYHIEHNALEPTLTPIVRTCIGRFLPKRVEIYPLSETIETFDEETGETKSEVNICERAVPIADLVIKPEFIEAFSKGKWPWLSVEINKPSVREFSSLAALTSRPPEVKQSPLAINPVQFSEQAGKPKQFYFSEEQCMAQQPQQFGASDLAKKIAGSWNSTKAKLLSSPKYAKLLDWYKGDTEAGGGLGGGWLSPEYLQGYLRTALEKLPVAEIAQLGNYLFSEDNGMGKEQQFGLVDDLKSLGAEYKKGGWQAVKNKLGSQETEEEFQKRYKEQGGRGFAEGDDMDEKKPEQFAMAPRSINYQGKVYKIRMNGDYTTDAGGAGLSMKEAQDLVKSGKATTGNEQGFAEEGEGASPIDQINQLLPSASNEVLAQILQLLQSAGGEVQAAENDTVPAPVAQFAEVPGEKLTPQKILVALNLMNERLARVEQDREKEKAMHFAEQRLSNVSQKTTILKELKGKPANSVKEFAEFAAKFAGKDPEPLDPNDLSSNPATNCDEETANFIKQCAPQEKERAMHFAAEWHTTAKTVPQSRFVRIQTRGYQPNAKKNQN